jgi:hypothetical protein
MEHWPLINSVRDAGDLLTIEEKQRLHNIVCRYKRTAVIFAADLEWLKQSAENFGGVTQFYELLSKSTRRTGGAA